ncbi:MAG: hypothetical protein ACLRIS_04255 [Flavonifractor plautii]
MSTSRHVPGLLLRRGAEGSPAGRAVKAAPTGWSGAASAGRRASAPTGRTVEMGAPEAGADSAGRAARSSVGACGAAEAGAEMPLPAGTGAASTGRIWVSAPADWGMEMGAPETPGRAAGAAPCGPGAVKSEGQGRCGPFRRPAELLQGHLP